MNLESVSVWINHGQLSLKYCRNEIVRRDAQLQYLKIVEPDLQMFIICKLLRKREICTKALLKLSVRGILLQNAFVQISSCKNN